MDIGHVDVERHGAQLRRRQGLTLGQLHPAYYLDVLKNVRVLNLLGTHMTRQRPFTVWLFDKLSRMMVAFRQDNLERHLPERVHTNNSPGRETSE